MKFAYFSLGLLSLFAPLAAAWSKEGKTFIPSFASLSPGFLVLTLPFADREIFRIRDEIMAHEADPAATFYDILGVPPSASLDDISKAYRLKSRALHPDKVKQQLRSDRVKAASKDGAKRSASTSPSASEVRAAVKRASERQARLSLIANILRGPLRTRYDHFLAHGFPLWKGTDYYYSRYRPGLGTVMAGLFAICGGAIHYLVLYMSWKRQREFVERYVKYARDAAWGSALSVPSMESAYAANQDQSDDDEGPPMPMNRRQRRMQDKESKREDGRSRNKKSSRRNQGSSSTASAAAAGPRKRVMAENGKVLVVDSLGSVFLEEEDEDGGVVEFLLDVSRTFSMHFREDLN